MTESHQSRFEKSHVICVVALVGCRSRPVFSLQVHPVQPTRITKVRQFHSELQTNVSFNASVSNLQTRRLLLHCTTALFNKCFEPASWWCLRLFSDSFYTKSSQWVKHGVLEKSCATYFWQAAKKIKQEFPWLHWLVFVLIQIMWCI